MRHRSWSGPVRAVFFGAVVSLTDLLPPRLRYGYVHRLTALVMRRPLPSLRSITAPNPAVGPPPPASPSSSPSLTCALATNDLDVGGIGPIVETLALGFARSGIRPVVVCTGDGARAARLRAAAVEVRSISQADEAQKALAGVDVIALHSAPEYLEQAAVATATPIVTAMHNTEIHFTRRRWKAFAALLERSRTGVAVSETVRRYHERHVPAPLADRILVIPNAAPPVSRSARPERAAARHALAETIATPLGDADVVFVCLARYDSQKNVAGTVASFLHALDEGLEYAHFVHAGEPSDWAEYWRADGIRRASPHRGRVHLLANSDAQTLLAAADAFVLNSFFEGWPVAATEAMAAGLPLILSDVGGAAELVSADQRSVLIPNASGDAAGVSDRGVRAARRRSSHQANRAEFGAALRHVAADVRTDRQHLRREATEDSVTTMIERHAAVVRAAALVQEVPTR